MIEVVVACSIDRPPAEVFGFLADSPNNPLWQRGMRSCRWTSDPPIGVGSTYDQEARFLGRPIRSSFEVVEFEPGRRIRIRTTESTMPLDITRGVEPAESGGSDVTATIRGGPEGWGRHFDPLTQWMVERSVTADYRRLKSLLESG